MNNPSPLVPQGSLLEQKSQNRARVKIAIFLVLAIHGIGLLALLMQGCKKEPDASGGTAGGAAEATNAPPVTFTEPTNAPAGATNEVSAPSNPPPPAVVETAPAPTAPTSPGPALGATEYTIASGDNFSAIAKKFHVSLKALMDANPGAQPTKLKIGQKINIPASAASAASGTTANPAAPGTEGGTAEQVYSVKSGDSLTRIANHFGTSVKALRSANHLKTDRIVVGQKLKIPVKGAATAEPAAAPASTPTGQ